MLMMWVFLPGRGRRQRERKQDVAVMNAGEVGGGGGGGGGLAGWLAYRVQSVHLLIPVIPFFFSFFIYPPAGGRLSGLENPPRVT